jgi:nucleoside-diphosphate-sugar epimerase
MNGTGLAPELSVLVRGAGGFLGGHLVRRLRQNGHRRIRGVDCKPLNDWFQHFDDVDNVVLDLREAAACREACAGIVIVFNWRVIWVESSSSRQIRPPACSLS